MHHLASIQLENADAFGELIRLMLTRVNTRWLLVPPTALVSHGLSACPSGGYFYLNAAKPPASGDFRCLLLMR